MERETDFLYIVDPSYSLHELYNGKLFKLVYFCEVSDFLCFFFLFKIVHVADGKVNKIF